MSVELTDAPPGDPRLARYFAKAVDLAYENETVGPAKFRDELGLDAHLISVGNTQVYVGSNDKNIVVAFRGSESPTSLDGLCDWLLTNANNLLVLPEGRAGTDFVAAGVGARFHRGFLEALEAIWQPLWSAVDSTWSSAERPVWLCGHSLGGSLATLAAWRLERNAIPVHQVYTFGAPMIGNDTAAAGFEKQFAQRVFRYIDVDDVVPKLPTISLTSNTYGHCPQECKLGDGPGRDIPTELAPGGDIPPTGIAAVWGFVMSQVSSHLMSNYIKRVEERCGG